MTNMINNKSVFEMATKLRATLVAAQEADRIREMVHTVLIKRATARAGKRIDKRDITAICDALNAQSPGWQVWMEDRYGNKRSLTFRNSTKRHPFDWNNRFSIYLDEMVWSADALFGANPHIKTIADRLSARLTLLDSQGQIDQLAIATLKLAEAHAAIGELLDRPIFEADAYALSRVIDAATGIKL